MMPSYTYKAYDRSGALRSGTIEAQSRVQALEALVRRGERPAFVLEGKPAEPLLWWEREVPGTGGLPRAGLAIFTRELATLLAAELPLDEALRILTMQPFLDTRMRRVAGAVLEQVMAGAALSQALARARPAFPEFYWRLVEAGEAGGHLANVLGELATALERANEARAKAVSALLYPAILMIAATIALAVIVTVLIPTIAPLFKDAGTPPPPMIEAIVAAQAFLGRNLVTLAAIGALLLAGLVGSARHEGLRAHRDRLLVKLPVAGAFLTRRETAVFSRTLGTLTGNGVAMLEAMRIAAQACRNRAFRNELRGAADAVSQGASLAQALRATGLFPELALRLVTIGEESGQLDSMLLRTASTFEALNARQGERLTSLIAPAMTILIGILVGSLILSVMEAIISINELAVR
jgi:general secretion pathway protein F